jgi:thiamine pyrophosphate-dependent acetolactate synthase large subunit-like protein
LIHIDVLSTDIDNDYRRQVELVGKIGATLKELIDRVNAGRPASSAELLREVGIERTAFVEKAAALNGTPNPPHPSSA